MNEDKKALARRMKIIDDLGRRQYPKKKDSIKNWMTTYCPKCGKKLEYVPVENWDGSIRCPHCQHKFKQVLLKDFKDIKKK